LKERDEGDDDGNGDAEKFFVNLKLMCDGRSFFFTEKGYSIRVVDCEARGSRMCVVRDEVPVFAAGLGHGGGDGTAVQASAGGVCAWIDEGGGDRTV
jgi:hypothetical protein